MLKKWIARFKAGAQAEELDSSGQLELLPTLLTQRAAIWWDAFGRNSRSISDALDGLAVAFIRPEKRNLLLQLPKKKQYNKTVEEYGWDLVRLCKAISSA